MVVTLLMILNRHTDIRLTMIKEANLAMGSLAAVTACRLRTPKECDLLFMVSYGHTLKF